MAVNDDPMAQHFVTCQLCPENVQFHCGPCNISLCESCVGGHLQTKTPEAHRFVHFHKFRGHFKSLKAEPEVMAVIECPYTSMLDIVRSGDSHFYVCSSISRHIHKHDFRQNVPLDSKLASGWPRRLANLGESIIFTERHSNTVNLLSEESGTKVLFDTGDWSAHGIASTRSGNIVVGLCRANVGKVAVFTVKGHVMQEVESYKGNPLYKDPYYVTENTNGDLCAADLVLEKVTVVNSSGLFRFSYTGHPSVGTHFDPHGIAADSQSNLVIADWATRKLHVIDGSGDFVRCLDFFSNAYSLEIPTGVHIDKDDLLFVCGYDNEKVKVIKYLQ